jgi:archaellum biogenesis protein FlaJ (TadC family)
MSLDIYLCLSVSIALVVIIACSVFVMPLVYLLGLSHDISSAIANGAFGAVAILVMLIVFADKYYSLLRLSNRSTTKVFDEATHSVTGGVSSAPLQIFSPDVIRSMKPDEQFEYYSRIIVKYTALRLQINCASENSSYATSGGAYIADGVAEEEDV